MRFLPALGLLPFLLLPAACSSAPVEETGGTSAAVLASCSASRGDIVASTSATRSNAIQRGFGWLDENVPYSQSKSHEGYRTDCSGFVSMCWELGASTNTADLYADGQYDSDLGSWDDLLPADALVRKGHVMLFLAWEPDKSGVCVLEQASTKSGMQFRVHPVASLRSQGFKPIRAAKLANDTAVGSDGTSPPATDTSNAAPPASDGTPSTDPSTPPASTPTPGCVSRAAADVCSDAQLSRGVACGLVVDECGQTVNCDTVAGFGCVAPQICTTAQQCVAPTACKPGLAATLCAGEKAAHGLQCGTISNGCGGTLSCDGVAGFGCAKNQTCSASHACVKSTTSAPPATPAAPTTSTDEGAAPPGAMGDDGENSPSSADVPATTGTGSSSSTTSPTALPKSDSPSASAGCSASSKGSGGSGGDALPFLALAAAVSLGRRRSRR